MMRILGAALVAAISFSGAVSAAPLSGTFKGVVANVTSSDYVTGLDSAKSAATIENFDAAADIARRRGGVQSLDFIYTGALDFATNDPKDNTTIRGWLNSGGGTVSGLDDTVGDLQLSKPNIDDGTATTTFFLFTLRSFLPATDFVVTHDDGFGIYGGDGFRYGGFEGPNSVRTTNVFGFDSEAFVLLYVATNGDPSILEVTPVPVPAALPLLLAGLGGFAFLRRRKAA